MPESYEEFLKANKEMVDKIIEKTGIQPYETHNRFGLLFIDRLRLKKHDYRPEKPLDYQSCKLMVGTTLLGAALDPSFDLSNAPHLHYCQKLARDKGWIIRHWDPTEVSFPKCVAAISLAFHSTVGFMPRPSDIRICLQLGSPTLWADASPSDMLIGHKEADMIFEATRAMLFARLDPPKKIEELWAGTIFFADKKCSGTLQVSPKIFAQEIQRYIEEHMKFELTSEVKNELIWRIVEYLK